MNKHWYGLLETNLLNLSHRSLSFQDRSCTSLPYNMLCASKLPSTAKKSERKFRQETQSDAKGLCSLDIDFRGRYFIALEKGEDRLFLSDQGHYNYERPNIIRASDKEERKLRMQFFLDRAIYRPGQPVYFKGLLIEEGEEEFEEEQDERVETEGTPFKSPMTKQKSVQGNSNHKVENGSKVNGTQLS